MEEVGFGLSMRGRACWGLTKEFLEVWRRLLGGRIGIGFGALHRLATSFF